ncbi:MAG: DUF429 domain-containing protein, partial [Thermoplasmata archaeon]|nr:DUF429 domain-containing protein [Thermoplasmata archaeon]
MPPAHRARNVRSEVAAPVVVGVDLAGSEGRRTGFCTLGAGGVTVTRVLHSDDEIVAAVHAASPSVVSIDAPLFLPKGRTSPDSREPFHLRASDRILQRLGIRFFTVTLGPMRTLTARGIRLRARLEADGYRTIEGYPGAGQDLLGI